MLGVLPILLRYEARGSPLRIGQNYLTCMEREGSQECYVGLNIVGEV